MNIALFASAFHPHVGGVEELVRQLAHSYKAKGHGVIVVTNKWPQDLSDFEEFEGISLYRLPMRLPTGTIKEQLKFKLSFNATERRMLDVLKEHKIDIIHIQCVSANGYYAHRAATALGLPLVVTTQGERTMDAGKIYQRSPFMNQMLRNLLPGSAHITACSGHTLKDLETWYGKPFEATSGVIYNGIDLSNFEPARPYSHPKPYILGIGRLVPQKGFDVLIRAFGVATLPDHDLLIAGEGPDRVELEQLAQELKLSDKVHFVGRADRPTAISLFQGCSFFVLPSRQEPQGIVNLEAMAAGKAVVASRVGGVPEIVLDNEVGILVEAEDVDSMASALRSVASSDDLRLKLGKAGRARAEQFDWKAIADQYVAIYSRAVGATHA
ncbi:MAG TPA: glycosyltransferase family 4 protein [Capsulimonadaceae bacterium]|jgi:glycosyltransferase involved in cell wall biosynthesis